MSFHGIPLANVQRGDPYAGQCERTAALLAEALCLEQGEWSLAYQSRFGRARWLEPYTDDTLERLARAGTVRVDVICPAFAADCLETLEEIAVLSRERFLAAGGGEYHVVPCLNAGDAHIRMMREIVSAHC
jgi:ferrochelatase